MSEISRARRTLGVRFMPDDLDSGYCSLGCGAESIVRINIDGIWSQLLRRTPRRVHRDADASCATAATVRFSTPESVMAMILVVCDDGRPRHAPFDTMHEARLFADWGHGCLARHTFKVVEPGYWAGFLDGLEAAG